MLLKRAEGGGGDGSIHISGIELFGKNLLRSGGEGAAPGGVQVYSRSNFGGSSLVCLSVWLFLGFGFFF